MYDFESLVNRENTGNLKECLTPAELSRNNQIIFAGAEMDFKTAPVMINALKRFASEGIFGFTLPDRPYTDAIRWWMQNARDFKVSAEEIVPTLGTIFSVGTAIRAFTQPGDGVIILHPVYYRYDVRVRENGRAVVSVPLTEVNNVYSLDLQALEAQMAQPRNKLLLLCNPHNPIGKVFTRQELESIRDLAVAYDVVVFSDEIFAEVAFDGHTVTPFVDIAPQNAITCTSLGKTFNLTGVNHANVIIRSDSLRSAFLKQRNTDHFGSIDPFFYCSVLAGYSPEGLTWAKAMKAYVWNNYTQMQTFFAQNLPRLHISPLEGGFVIWIDFRALGLDDEALAAFLEQDAQMYLDRGSDYGPQGRGYCRMNIASPNQYIQSCLGTLHKAYCKRGFA
ncbi:MAG TPA: aminotransferase class I/II-fold pyridoxal phosphate-dependent enzyme [Candidatus Limiplasma sp.]|nr:aminotransferase class I/II-fold pyridoxal phosphate-dependent enzyme [Candidatus Limiplasma sp.]HRX07856.1 aminotransferase class I/II-fold pyridoxal phosphate-dependent enzyme [Candidatus Limiplasma sp.]